MYDQEKDNLKNKVTQLTKELASVEREKESSNDVIQSSLKEVNALYGQKIDFLQKELLDTRTIATSRCMALTKELNDAQKLIKEHEKTISSLKTKLKDTKYHNEISQKATKFKLEKSE